MRKTPKQSPPVSRFAGKCGKRIFQLRCDNDWSQRVAAKKAGFSVAYFCDVENGKRRIGAEKLYKLAKLFNVSMDSFFEA